MDKVIELPGIMTAEQAAAMMGVSVRYLYRIRRFLPPSRVGRALIYRMEDVEAYIASHPRLKRAI